MSDDADIPYFLGTFSVCRIVHLARLSVNLLGAIIFPDIVGQVL